MQQSSKSLKVILAGGSGLVGQALAAELQKCGHQVWILSRRPGRATAAQDVRIVEWDGRTAQGWGELVNDTDAIVNLAGENMGAGRWTRARKEKILASRLQAGQAVVEAVRSARRKPGLVIQASAIGYYGNRNGEEKTEASPPGDDFLAKVCIQWENSTRPLEDDGVQRAVVRSALVLSERGGTLDRMRLAYRFFLSGPLGSGRQWWSWIHIADEVSAICFILENQLAGPFNLTAPEPVLMRDFGKALARAMHRPYWFPAPAFGIRILLGGMSALVLNSMRILPARLNAAGFQYQFPELQSALHHLVR